MANSKNITFDQLQNALTRVKSALDGKANTSHGNHVPKTETANNAKFLRNDNTWQTITPVNIGAADRSHSHGSYANQNAFSNIKVGDTTVAADSPTDTLTLTAGSNITITPDATNDNVTIAAKDTVYTHPTSSGNKHIPSGGSSGQILRWSADGTAAWGSDNNTDTKVTNTLNTTAKAYVTGTTSATTNTGTQIFDTGVYLDTTAGKLVASTFSGALSGNASSATKLQNARNIKIGNTTRSFNGTADVTWTLGEIGAAAASHNHTSLTGVTKLQFAAGSSDSAIMKVTTEEANTYLDFEMNDDINTDMYRWRFSAYDTNGATPYFNLMTLTAKDTSSARLTVNGDITASSFTGNASSATSATKLQTARSINGTNFDGSGNITTANWGTSRTLTVGNTGKSVNGGGNVSWSIDEIGALKASKQGTTDVNTLKTTGRYFIKGTLTNAPTSNNGVIDVAWDVGTPYQIFYPDNVNTAYKRTWNSSNSTWNGWTQLMFTDTNTWRGIQNNLTSDATDQSLSAAQGKVLKGLVDGKAAKSHGNHVPATQAADNKKFLRNDNTWQTVTPDNIGAVPIDTGGNITIHADSDASSTSEYALIKAGHNELKVASSAGGGTVTKGQDKLTFNGNIVYHAGRKPTLSELGAAAANHSHSNYAASNHSHSNYAASSHEHNYLNVKGTNTINTTANDTTAKWGAQKNSVHWYTETNKINGQPSQWGYLVNIGQDSEVHQVWMTQSSGDLLHRGGNNSGWSGSWRTILDSSNYSTWAAAKSHTHDYAASNHTHNYAAANHTHNYAASNHNHDGAYLKLSGGTLSGQLTVNNTVQSQGFCVSKNGKEVWLDIGDNDTYIWTSGANKSLQITHGGDLNFDGKPVIYGGRGNSFSTAVGSIYFKNSANTYAARISSYHNTDLNQDYAHMGIRDVNDNMPNYINLYPDTVRIKSNNIELGGKRLTIATSAPSNPSNGDVWINIG